MDASKASKALEKLVDMKLADGKTIGELPEFNEVARFVDEQPSGLEAAISPKLCKSSWCSCRSTEIAKAVREYLSAQAKDL